MPEASGETEHPAVVRIRNAIGDFLRYAADAMSLIDLAERGAQAILGYRGINRQIRELDTEHGTGWTAEQAARLASVEEVARLAESEIERGFPLLHNHALMGLWGALEVMVDDVSANWLDLHPEFMISDRFPKIQVDLNQFLALDQSEQKRHVVEELKRKQGSALRIGVGQFEGLLDAIGLGGPVDPDVRNVLRIAKSFRNVVAHRGGKVDGRLLGDCPDLGLELGQQIRIHSAQMNSIVFAMWVYAEGIDQRRRAASGLPACDLPLPPGVDALSQLSDPFSAATDQKAKES